MMIVPAGFMKALQTLKSNTFSTLFNILAMLATSGHLGRPGPLTESWYKWENVVQTFANTSETHVSEAKKLPPT